MTGVADDWQYSLNRLKKLAHSVRWRVVRELMKGPRRVNELASDLNIEQSLLSHHLRILRQANMVAVDRDGRKATYSLSPNFAEYGKTLNLGDCRICFNGCSDSNSGPRSDSARSAKK